MDFLRTAIQYYAKFQEKPDPECVFFYFFYFFMYVIQQCFICRPSNSTVSEDAGIEPMDCCYTFVLTARRSLTTRLDLILNVDRVPFPIAIDLVCYIILSLTVSAVKKNNVVICNLMLIIFSIFVTLFWVGRSTAPCFGLPVSFSGNNYKDRKIWGISPL